MNLSPNFTYEEMVKSDTARIRGILNQPNYKELDELTKLCKKILQPVRDAFGKPIIVTSGFRSEALNKAVGGVSTSQHRFGQAADIKAQNGKNRALWDLMKSMVDNKQIEVGQLIWEKGDTKAPSWIHVSLPDAKHKNQILYLR